MNTLESQDWKQLSKKEKKEIKELFEEKQRMDLFEKYKTLSYIDLTKELEKDKLEKNSYQIYFFLVKIIVFLNENDRYLSELCSFSIDKTLNYIEVDENNISYISSEFIDFEIDSILSKIYKEHIDLDIIKGNCKVRNLNNCRLYIDDFKSIYINLINYKKKEKVIFNTYLLTDASGFIKIGKAIDVNKRFYTLKTGNPTLIIVASLHKDIESILHKKFYSQRIVGEWFRLSQKDIKEIIEEYNFVRNYFIH